MPSTEYPFSVRTTDSLTLVKGYDDLDKAHADAGDRNNRAEKMGLTTRYEAMLLPAKRGKQ